MATIQSLHIHPVKSCRAIDCATATLGAHGLVHDREWVVVDDAGRFLSERTHPRLARAQAALVDGALRLSSAGAQMLDVPLQSGGDLVDVEVWRDRCRAIDQGDDAAAWFSELLGQRVRLVRVAPDLERCADRTWTGSLMAPTAFQDDFPLLVCNRASLDDLNRRLPQPLPMSRFRPNLVIEGLEAWEEDHLAAIEIGAARVALVKPCTRCVITATDPETGERSLDPLPVLRQFRFDQALAGVTFGENAVLERGLGAVLRCGDSVRAIHDGT